MTETADPDLTAPDANTPPPDSGTPPPDAGTPDPDVEKPPASALEDPGADDPVKAPTDWPSDWRTKMAGEDADALKRLERYKSPNDLAKALTEAQNKLRSTRAMPTLGENPSDEEIAAYRKDMGVPEKAEAYLEKLPDGLVIGEDDKPVFESFAQAAHEANIPAEQAQKMLDWYAQLGEQEAAAQSDRDNEARSASIEELRAELGGEYLPKMNAVKAFVEGFGEGITENLFGARLADGTLLGDNPNMLRLLMDMQQKVNPMGIVAPADGKTSAETVTDRIAEIEGVMRTDRAKYNKDTAMQEELRRLYEFQDKQNAA